MLIGLEQLPSRYDVLYKRKLPSQFSNRDGIITFSPLFSFLHQDILQMRIKTLLLSTIMVLLLLRR